MRPLDRLKRKILVENLWVFILKLLSEKNHFGFEIRNKIKRRFGFIIGNVTAYKVLYLLEKGSYISSFRDGNKKYYRITTKGRKELNEANKFLKKLIN